jgi:hypothetical protein
MLLSAKEKGLIEEYRKLDEAKQKAVSDLVENLSK